MSNLASEWFEPYHKGEIKSKDRSEEWTYDRGSIAAVTGQWKGTRLTFNGSDIEPVDHDKVPKGRFNGQALHVVFSKTQCDWLEGTKAFASSKLTVDGDAFHWTNSNLKHGSKCDVTQDKTSRTATVKCAGKAPEGLQTEWEVLGEVPPPVVLFLVWFTRADKLLEQWRTLRNRTLSRCNKLCMNTKVQPQLCESCFTDHSDECINCGATGANSPGCICKTCQRRRFFCGRCDSPVGQFRQFAKVCSSCSGRECNHMLAEDHPMV